MAQQDKEVVQHPEAEELKAGWLSYLATVDERPPKSSVLEATAAWYVAQGFVDPASVEGVSEEDVDSTSPPKELVVKAFLKRSLRNINAVHAAKRQRPADATGATGAGAAGADHTFAASESALALARSLTQGVKSVDLLSKIAQSSVAGLPFHLQVDSAVWHVLEVESAAARACTPRGSRTRTST
jgi:hypothetical protein